MDDPLHHPAIYTLPEKQHVKSRGAISNPHSRFDERIRVINVDDASHSQDEEVPVSSLATVLHHEVAKSILSRNQSPDLPFNVSLNPYRGCEHGCIYCYARPSHGYLGLSAGLEFETQIYGKLNAAELLRMELGKNSYIPQPIAIGVNTDAYQPQERHLNLTRKCLEVLQECRHPVGLITKSTLIERDIDILGDMATQQLAVAAITLTTLDNSLARILEPRAASPKRRLETLRKLSHAGIPTMVSVAPVIPFITDNDLEAILTQAAEAGATSASYTVLRLPHEVNLLFKEWLALHFPERADRVMARVRDLHGNKDYNADFATRMRGSGLWADLFRQRFHKTCRKVGLNRDNRYDELRLDLFQRPRWIPVHAKSPQQDLFNF